jgi:aspartate/methionine/tyrosine aminotransferase
MERLGTETAFEVLARAREIERTGRHVVHLEIGEPDFDTPRFVSEAAMEALRQGYTHYGPSAGLPEFREVIAHDVGARRGVTVAPDQVVVTPGAKPIIFYAAMALLQEGDEVVFPDPGFPIYESVVEVFGAKAVPLQLREEDGFGLDLDRLRSLLTARTKMVILNSPQNPTGGMITAAQIEGLAALLADWPDVWVFADEIYGRIVYEQPHASILSLPGFMDRTILLDGFSKTYAMTGWRLGYGVMPRELATRVARLQTNCTSCTASFVQRAGMAALTGPQDEVDAMVVEFRRRRDRIVGLLNDIPGVRCNLPGGAFYVYPNVSGTGMTGPDLAKKLLDEAGVAALSGSAFGKSGREFLRFSYANSIQNIELGMQRFRDYLASR